MRRDNHETATNYPKGFCYRPDLVGPDEEAALVERVRELPFKEFEFHGYTGKRRTVSFGWHYDFSGRQLRKADDIPDFLLPLRETAAAFAGMGLERLQHVLVIEYGPEPASVGTAIRRSSAMSSASRFSPRASSA